MTSSVPVFEAVIRVKSVYMTKSLFQKRKYGNQRHFYIYLHLKAGLEMEFTACLRRTDARGRADIICGIAHIAILRGRHSYGGHKV